MSTMTFRLNGNGELELVNKKIDKIIKEVKEVNSKSVKKISKFSDNYILSVTPVGLVLATTAVASTAGTGIFWDAFMKYLFPYMLDIAKVFCAIKVAQGFYNEKRGGKDSGSGMEALLTYGKWYLLFTLMPWAVELLDQLGSKMLMDLRGGE